MPAVKAALLAAAARFDAILPEPAPFVNILEYRDSQIAYTLRVWVRTPDYWDVRFALLEAVGEEFDSHGSGNELSPHERSYRETVSGAAVRCAAQRKGGLFPCTAF